MSSGDLSGDIEVQVVTRFLEEESEPDAERYVFAYTIRIVNRSQVTSQLKNRHWIITDAAGEVEEVRGAGVVGQQPVLEPEASFEYTSGAILKTPVGAMQGAYEFEDPEGRSFDVPIPPFSLSVPKMVH